MWWVRWCPWWSCCREGRVDRFKGQKVTTSCQPCRSRLEEQAWLRNIIRWLNRTLIILQAKKWCQIIWFDLFLILMITIFPIQTPWQYLMSRRDCCLIHIFTQGVSMVTKTGCWHTVELFSQPFFPTFKKFNIYQHSGYFCNTLIFFFLIFLFKKYAAYSPQQETDCLGYTHTWNIKEKRKHFGQLNLAPLPHSTQVISQRQLQICKIKPWIQALAGWSVVHSGVQSSGSNEVKRHRTEKWVEWKIQH